MKKIVTFLLLIMLSAAVYANDGVFYAQGNQLIPIKETEISVQREVLSLNGRGAYVEVSVYYEFYNPTDKVKDVLVGFEAASPYPYEGYLGDFPEQPNIKDFKVIVNGQTLKYNIAHVENGQLVSRSEEFVVPSYYDNGKINGWSKDKCMRELEEEAFIFTFDYVYYFNASFRPGVNIIKHTYSYLRSNSVDFEYSIPYVLTAACRWANRQIDDFTLNINMGDRESFLVEPTFFDSADEWILSGIGRVETTEYLSKNTPMFHMREGGITFHRTSFRPKGELYVLKPTVIWSLWSSWDDNVIYGEDAVSLEKDMYLDMSLIMKEKTDFTELEKRIMKNVPFAHRGYVFKSRELQEFFESTHWYVPDPEYVPDVETLNDSEKQWVTFWSK